MKNIKYIIALSLTFVFLQGCEDRLEEENHSKLVPDFFATTQGFVTGLNAAYGGMRELYGPEEGIQGLTNVGTDEFRTAASGTRSLALTNYTSLFTPGNEYPTRLWSICYKYINTCNGLVDLGANITDISEESKNRMIAEAKFLRANYYFLLVQNFGDVTLNKSFQNTPTTSADRHSVLDVYAFIIEDLTAAKQTAYPSPKLDNVLPGKATGATIRHLLAKVYLTLGWIHNKNNPEDPHSVYYNPAKAQEYFNLAYEEANSLITDAPGLGIGLLDNFADVHKAKNENNKEVLYSVQYGGSVDNKVYGGDHPLNHPYVTAYTLWTGNVRNVNDGRPFAWYRGTPWLYNVAFADKVNDSRYAATFQTAWYAYVTVGKTNYTVKNGSESASLSAEITTLGDTLAYLPGYNMTIAEMTQRTQNRGAGKNKFRIYTPENYNNQIFPTLKKYLDPNRLAPNDNSMRPIIVYRLGETYLIAAEAAFLTNRLTEAASLINVVRQRAGYAGKKDAMLITTADLNMDFILAERSRELCGELVRWFDLVRTGTLVDRVRAYDDNEAFKNIQYFHMLRPIPQNQIDRTITGAKYPQNPGW
jgi:starch-binding outer membrane protein, SusD/RagB family